jgi:hypothetical protein
LNLSHWLRVTRREGSTRDICPHRDTLLFRRSQLSTSPSSKDGINRAVETVPNRTETRFVCRYSQVLLHTVVRADLAVGPLGSRPRRRVSSKCQALVSGRQPVRSALGTTVRKETPLPNNSHQRAAELHDLAAHAHRAAAAHHGKEDHQTAHEHSKQALEYSNKAHQRSEEAVKKSADTAV